MNGNQERVLVYRMLERSIYDLKNKSKRIRRESRQWFDSESLEPFSYLWVCELFELSPIALKEFVINNDVFFEERKRSSRNTHRHMEIVFDFFEEHIAPGCFRKRAYGDGNTSRR